MTTSFPRNVDDGYAKFVFEQAKSLLRIERGYEVVVIAPHAPGLKRTEVIDNITVHRFRYFLPTSTECLAYQHEGLFNTLRRRWMAIIQLPCFMLSMMFSLFMHSRNASVIHAQWLPTLLVAVPIAKVRKIPVFVSVRGADLNQQSSFVSTLTKLCLDQVDMVLTVSNSFKQKLSRVGASSPIETLYNGVDVTNFSAAEIIERRRQLGIGSNQFLVTFVGGLISRKNLDTLLDAMEELSLSGHNCGLLVVGEGPLGSYYRNVVRDKGLCSKVDFIGHTNRDSVSALIAIADVLVLPSSSEGRPNVVLEAFAVKTAVIASDVEGTNELVSSGVNGLLFPCGDSHQLVQCLVELEENSDEKKRLAQAGYETLKAQELTWSAHGQRLDSLYQGFVK